jgi:hypothetical protein
MRFGKRGVFGALLCASAALSATPAVAANAAARQARTRFSHGVEYHYVHAHLDQDPWQCENSETEAATFWADPGDAKGFCPGKFIGGTHPFNYVAGWSLWKYVDKAELPPQLKGLPLVGGRAIRVTQVLARGDWRRFYPTPATLGERIVCYVSWRGSGDCYTDYETQHGKAASTSGGPLHLDAHDPASGSNRNVYIFLVGWCKEGDPLCTPHRPPTVR